MIDNNLIQAALIGYLKNRPTVVATLSSSGQIKEDQWQGILFSYPAIRLDLRKQTPLGEVPCNASLVSFSILCYSEGDSSKEATNISWKVNEQLHGKSFTYLGVRFVGVVSDGLIPADRKDSRTWVAEASFQCKVQTAI